MRKFSIVAGAVDTNAVFGCWVVLSINYAQFLPLMQPSFKSPNITLCSLLLSYVHQQMHDVIIFCCLHRGRGAMAVGHQAAAWARAWQARARGTGDSAPDSKVSHGLSAPDSKVSHGDSTLPLHQDTCKSQTPPPTARSVIKTPSPTAR